MKNILKLSFLSVLAFFFAAAAFAKIPDGYAAVSVPAAIDAAQPPSGESSESGGLSLLVAESDCAGAVKSALAKIAEADESAMSGLITKPKDLKRALKFAKGSKLKEVVSSMSGGAKYFDVFKVGKFNVAVFDKSFAMRPGMNFMAFENSGGRLLWNASFSDPLMLLLADGRRTEAADAKMSMPGDAKIAAALTEKKLPILNFSNGVLVSLEPDGNVEGSSCAKFYHEAQKFFFDCKLKEYSQYMTSASRERFESQFMSMSEAEQKNVLKDYFSWKKRYLRAMEAEGAGGMQILFFARERNGDSPQNDITYFSGEGGKMKIANWGAPKSPLDMFLSRYVLKDGEYLKNISDRFAE